MRMTPDAPGPFGGRCTRTDMVLAAQDDAS